MAPKRDNDYQMSSYTNNFTVTGNETRCSERKKTKFTGKVVDDILHDAVFSTSPGKDNDGDEDKDDAEYAALCHDEEPAPVNAEARAERDTAVQCLTTLSVALNVPYSTMVDAGGVDGMIRVFTRLVYLATRDDVEKEERMEQRKRKSAAILAYLEAQAQRLAHEARSLKAMEERNGKNIAKVEARLEEIKKTIL